MRKIILKVTQRGNNLRICQSKSCQRASRTLWCHNLKIKRLQCSIKLASNTLQVNFEEYENNKFVTKSYWIRCRTESKNDTINFFFLLCLPYTVYIVLFKGPAELKGVGTSVLHSTVECNIWKNREKAFRVLTPVTNGVGCKCSSNDVTLTYVPTYNSSYLRRKAHYALPQHFT